MGDKIYAYIGTYTSGDSEGVYTFSLDEKTGELKQINTTSVENPTYLHINEQKNRLYTVSRNKEGEGSIASFHIEKETGKLSFLNNQSTSGKGACHLTTDEENYTLFAANYHDGTVIAFPIEEDGKIGEASRVISYEGTNLSHMHYVALTPDNNHICMVDLGRDSINVYNKDIVYNEKFSIEIEKGSGPRHLTFSKDGRFMYLINELASSIDVFSYDASAGFEKKQRISTLPEEYSDTNSGAAIHCSKDGRFLYASNRGHDSIVIFEIEQETGLLSLVRHKHTEGKNPRDFSIDPTGRFLIVANQDSNNLITFPINQATGKLDDAVYIANVPTPVCVIFLEG